MEEQTIDFIRQIIQVTDDIGALLKVEYIMGLTCSDKIEAIVFNFENQTFTVKAVPDDDTIEIFADRLSCNWSGNLIDASQEKPWLMAIGKRPRWSWALVNQQGYHDAIQFEFASDTSVIIQLVTVASSLKIYELKISYW